MNKETKAIIHGIKWMNDTESEHISTFTFEGDPIDLYWAIVEWYDDEIGFDED